MKKPVKKKDEGKGEGKAEIGGLEVGLALSSKMID